MKKHLILLVTFFGINTVHSAEEATPTKQHIITEAKKAGIKAANEAWEKIKPTDSNVYEYIMAFEQCRTRSAEKIFFKEATAQGINPALIKVDIPPCNYTVDMDMNETIIQLQKATNEFLKIFNVTEHFTVCLVRDKRLECSMLAIDVWRHRIIVSPIALKKLSFNALRGALLHELGHSLDNEAFQNDILLSKKIYRKNPHGALGQACIILLHAAEYRADTRAALNTIETADLMMIGFEEKAKQEKSAEDLTQHGEEHPCLADRIKNIAKIRQLLVLESIFKSEQPTQADSTKTPRSTKKTAFPNLPN